MWQNKILKTNLFGKSGNHIWTDDKKGDQDEDKIS